MQEHACLRGEPGLHVIVAPIVFAQGIVAVLCVAPASRRSGLQDVTAEEPALRHDDDARLHHHAP